jgi:hypothetical protein
MLRMIGKPLVLAAMTTVIVACSDNDKTTHNTTNQSVSDVLVTVNGSQITQNDLDEALLRMFGEFQMSMLQEDGYKKALESMVASRAIALASEKQLDTETLAKINRKAATYRENLLVSYYVKENANINPVTDEMVKDFYIKYPERYGAKTVRTYEMLFSEHKITQKQRAEVIKQLTAIKDQKHWEDAVDNLANASVHIKYRKGYTEENLITPRLRALMMNLEINSVSNVTFVEGKPYIVRVLSEKKIPPQPLEEVSEKIRKALAPNQFKKAVKEVSEKVLKTAKVVYANDLNN